MTERVLSGNNFVNSANISAKMSNDLTPRKTMLILVIVVGCFAVLWPKVFYPMLVGSANQHIKPSPIDKTTGCCDMISEIDVNTIKIMSELCRTIIKKDDDLPLTGRELVTKCQSAVLKTCGIDISSVLQEQVRLGQSVKQILDEVRSLNGSLCLKYNFGVAPWRLGVPHRVAIKMSPSSIRQERPLHLRSELVHPAFTERGRAIPQPHTTSPRATARIVEGRPGPIPGMRPTLGGAGHVVPPPKQGTGSMGLIMPIYTIGIVIFFTYTVLKIIFKKQPEALYPPVEPDPNFRKEVFESERRQAVPKLTREGVSSKLGDAELDQLRQRLRETELAMERIVEQMAKVPLKLQNVIANGSVPQEDEQPSVKVLGMEMTASCEGGKKWSRPNSPVLPSQSPHPQEPPEPPQEIFLEGSLPAQSHLLVADSATEAEKTNSEEDPAVVLAGKMTLSVISLDSSENGTDESSNLGKKREERSCSNVSDEFEKIEPELDCIEEPQNTIDSLQQLHEIQLLEQIQNEMEEMNDKHIIAKLKSEKPFSENEESGQTKMEFIEGENCKEYEPSVSIKPAVEESVIDESTINKTEIFNRPSTEDINIENSEEKLSDIRKTTIVADIDKNQMQTKISTLEEKEEKENLNKCETEPFVTQLSNVDSEQVLQSTDNINISEQIPHQQLKTPEHIETTTSEQLSSIASNTLLEPLLSSHVPKSLESNVVSHLSSKSETAVNLEDTHEKVHEVDGGSGLKDEKSQPDNIKTDISKIETGDEKTKLVEPLFGGVSIDEKESFEKLNEAVSELSSEFRSSDEKQEVIAGIDEKALDNDEEVEYEYEEKALDNDEEVEYEYEDSDIEVADEEIHNTYRLDDDFGDVARDTLNGENQEHSKYATTSNVTLAENEISNEVDMENENEDGEVQEIIEYISDDEEEVDDIVQPANSTNHVPERPDLQ